MKLAWRIYRWLANAFPHEFKLAYGDEVMQLGEDVVKEIAQRRGIPGLVRLIADISIRLPIEYLSEMRSDIRYSWRGLIKSPGFALVGIISIGLGIGLTTNIYSSELELLFRPLPAAANAGKLVMLQDPASYHYIEQYGDQKTLFTGVAAFRNGVPFNITFQGERNAKSERVSGQLVSPDYFSVLGVPAQRGRLLSASLDKPGYTPAVVISDRFWRNRLDSSPTAVGQTLRLNGQTAMIVGITPRNFTGAGSINPAEIFVPVTVPPTLAPELANDVLHQRNAKEFSAIFCLAPGVTIDSAEAALDTITRGLDEQVTSEIGPVDQGRRVTLVPAGTVVPIPRKLRSVALGFFVVLMGLILALACMNLSNMLLARAANRRKELAIRLSVGASRFRVVRQMMSEGILLSLLGGTAGFALAYWLSVLSSQLNLSAELSSGPDPSLDWRAGLFAFGLAIICGIGLSVVPALQVTSADLTPALKEGSALQLPGHRGIGLRNLLVLGQVAGSLMLLLITGFLVLGISKLSRVETKLDPSTMYLLSLDPVRDGYTAERARDLFEKLPSRLKTRGGVRTVALAGQPPFTNQDATTQMIAERSLVQRPLVQETVGAGYFATLSEPMMAGREFTEMDQLRDGFQALPVVLNESAARGFFGNSNAIGQHLKDDKGSYEVVGVIRDLNNGVGTRQAVAYLSLTRRDFAQPPSNGMVVMVRSSDGASGPGSVRDEIASLDPNLTVFNIQTLSQYLDYSRAEMRFAVRTYGGIGLFGLVLAAIGLAGVTAYAVAQRQKEIGIRTALGATKMQILRLVLHEGAALVIVGTAVGFVGAVAITKILASMTSVLVEAFSVGTNDGRLLIGAPLLLALLAMLACYLPAHRAAKIDPLQALREG